MRSSSSILVEIEHLICSYSILVVFVAMCVGLSILSPVFLTWDNFLNILLSGSVIGICAVGMMFVILTGGIDISVGSVLFMPTVIAAILLIVTEVIHWIVDR